MTESELFAIWDSLYSKNDFRFVSNWWRSLEETQRQTILYVLFDLEGVKL